MLAWPDGSTAQIAYLANASTDLSKERWEVHADGRSALCDNFRVTTLPNGRKIRGLNQDKGQRNAIEACRQALATGAGSPIPLREVVATSNASIATLESIARGAPVETEVGGRMGQEERGSG
jgi:hypothetical protein